MFINRKLVVPVGVWLPAEDHKTKGYAHRVGWHATLKPIAPHLTTKGRVWAEVDITEPKMYNRPESQGGTWVLGQAMRVNKLLMMEDTHI